MKQPTIQPPLPHLDGRGLTIGIVVARYNWHITGAMLQKAQSSLHLLGVASEDIHVCYTPGSFELATIAKALIESATYHAIICIGCIMKGATRHDVLVGDAVAQGIQQVALKTGVPTVLGVICAENQQQAEERIARGTECAEAAIEMACTLQTIRKKAEEKEKAYVYRDC